MALQTNELTRGYVVLGVALRAEQQAKYDTFGGPSPEGPQFLMWTATSSFPTGSGEELVARLESGRWAETPEVFVVESYAAVVEAEAALAPVMERVLDHAATL